MHLICICVFAPLLIALGLIVYFKCCRSTDKLFRLKNTGISARIPGRHGQSLIEYMLMAGFVIVAAVAIMPGLVESIATSMHLKNSLTTPSRFGLRMNRLRE